MAEPPLQRYTVEQYLAMEPESRDRHEYFDGQIFVMAGSSREHAEISRNVVLQLGAQLSGSGCRLYLSDMAVKVETRGLYTYPDASVTCGEPEFDGMAEIALLLNPKVIFEVLSPSTEAYDRGQKFKMYGEIDSLTDYVLIAQDQPWAQRFTRENDRDWRMSQKFGLDETVHIESIDCALRLSDIYLGVVFPANPPLRG